MGGMARQYNVHEAKTHLSRILEQVESGDEVVISRAGRPVARLVPIHRGAHLASYGSLRGRLDIAEDFDELPEDIADAFGMR